MRAKSEEEDGIEYVQSDSKRYNSIIISTLFIISIFLITSVTSVFGKVKPINIFRHVSAVHVSRAEPP